MRIAPAAWCAVALSLLACEDVNTSGSRTGSVSVVVTTTGAQVHNALQIPIGVVAYISVPSRPDPDFGVWCGDDNVIPAGGEGSFPLPGATEDRCGCEIRLFWWLCPFVSGDPVFDTALSCGYTW
jgi:hypothetical protein